MERISKNECAKTSCHKIQDPGRKTARALADVKELEANLSTECTELLI